MYHLIVRRTCRRHFERLNRGDVDGLLRAMTPDVRHYFPGDHALGGERVGRAAVHQWFGRLTRLLPGLRLTVVAVSSGGPPWRTLAVVEWTARAELAGGSTYVNRGAHVLRLRWGRVSAFHAYMDSQRTAAALDELGREGIAEAQAVQITAASTPSGRVGPCGAAG